MRKETLRGQLFKEKLQRLQLEGELRSVKFSIKYNELAKKLEDAEYSFSLAQARMNSKEEIAYDSN
ncbi:hypothetical protein [Bacillus cereus]|uniref:hypothetical protein n=1 Tax=Bacillus cereus TaxID=1396 RepID=UPI0025A1E6B6|nr:hypothetical protein [Bacillus cereus]MDM5459990.1 hypothetical protein [Bacillus cereus]